MKSWGHFIINHIGSPYQDGKKSIKKSQTSCLSFIWIVNSSIQLFSATTVSLKTLSIQSLPLIGRKKSYEMKSLMKFYLANPSSPLPCHLSRLGTTDPLTGHSFGVCLPQLSCNRVGKPQGLLAAAYRVSLIFLQAPQSSDPLSGWALKPHFTDSCGSLDVMPAHCHQGHLRHGTSCLMGHCLGFCIRQSLMMCWFDLIAFLF